VAFPGWVAMRVDGTWCARHCNTSSAFLEAPWAARPGLRLYTVLVMLFVFFCGSGCGSWTLWED
jgi:hypothetical protein